MTDELKPVDEVKQMMIKSDFIGNDDDAFPYLILLGVYQLGVNKRKVRKWLGSHVKDRYSEFKRMWQLAIDNSIFIDDCLTVEDVDEGLTDVELGLYAGTLLGLFTRSLSK